MTLTISQILVTSVLTGAGGYAPVASTQASPQAVVEAKFAAVNRHATDDIVRLYAQDAQVYSSGFCTRRGHGDVRRTYESLFATYPDIVADIHEYVVQGDRVVVRFTARSRPPGNALEVLIVNFFTVRNGLIEVDDGVFDTRGRPCRP